MLKNLIINIAVPEDAPGITEVRRTTWLATYPNKQAGITKSDIEAALNKRTFQEETERWRDKIEKWGSSRFWVAKDNGKVIGFASAWKEEKAHHLGGFYILPVYQSMGIGKKLIKEILDWLGDDKDIHLEVVTYNIKAINFYKKFGFVENGLIHTEVAKISTGKEMPEIDMIKRFKL